MNNHGLIRAAFDAYNERDAEALLKLIADTVEWPSKAGLLHGKVELRDFWVRQWETTRTHDEVTRVDRPAPDRAVAHISQTVRSIDGAVLLAGTFAYTFTIEHGLIRRLETRPT